MRDRAIWIVGKFKPFELAEQISLNDFHVCLDSGVFVCVAHSVDLLASSRYSCRRPFQISLSPSRAMPEAVIETVMCESLSLSMNFHWSNSCKTDFISAVQLGSKCT